jgi:hypothetical protein
LVGLARRRSRWAGPFNGVGSWRGRKGAGGLFGSVLALDLAVVTSCDVTSLLRLAFGNRLAAGERQAEYSNDGWLIQHPPCPFAEGTAEIGCNEVMMRAPHHCNRTSGIATSSNTVRYTELAPTRFQGLLARRATAAKKRFHLRLRLAALRIVEPALLIPVPRR